MEWVYTFVHNFLMGILICLFYQKILKIKLTKVLSLLSAALCFALYMLFAHSFIIEPIRTVIGILLLGFMFWVFKRSVNWACLTIAFIYSYFAWILSLLAIEVVHILFPVIHSDNIELFVSALIFVEAVVYFVIYKLVKFKNIIQHINDVEVKLIIYFAAGIFMSIAGIYHISLNRMQDDNPLLRYAFIFSLSFVVLALSALIVYLAKRHRDNVAKAKHIHKLEQGHQDLEQKNVELERKHDVAVKSYKVVVDQNHKYKDVVPAVHDLYSEFSEQLKTITSGDMIADPNGVKKQLDSMKDLATEIANEFAVDNVKLNIELLRLPDSWYALEKCIEKYANECSLKKFAITLHNSVKADAWESLTVSTSEFIRLAGNLLGNSIKELERTDTNVKQVRVRFFHDSDAFAFEIQDSAHEFSVDVLSKLGERGNSTNGTGNGYAEIFDFLAKYKASLIITEFRYQNDFDKFIKVVFDNKARVVVRTEYRYEILKSSLKNTNIEVEDINE